MQYHAWRTGLDSAHEQVLASRSASLILEKEEQVQRKDVTQEAIDEKCPLCSSPLSIRLGRNGRFIGCTNYPECSYTRNLNDDAATSTGPENPSKAGFAPSVNRL